MSLFPAALYGVDTGNTSAAVATAATAARGKAASAAEEAAVSTAS